MALFFSKLDFGQLKAVTSKYQHVLCLAGAGSGKTRVLISRILYLIKNGVNPKNILAITFTKNATLEMLSRLAKYRIDVENLWCKTFHSVCFRILCESLAFQKSERNKIKIIDEITQERIINSCVNSLQKEKEFSYNFSNFLEENNWPKDLFFEELFKVIKECKSRTISPIDLRERCKKANDEVLEFYNLAIPIFSYYQKMLRKLNQFDFSDLINQTIFFLKKKPFILNYYQNKFKYILVDEYQDVNFGQVIFLDLLAGEQNNLFVVGDDWQSIYGWRGSNIKYILDFKKKYKKTVQIIVLPFNYRSDGYIVDMANKVIKKNRNQYRKKIKPFHQRKIKVNLFYALDKRKADEFVIKKIKSFLKRRVNFEDMMILGRTWKVLSPFLKKFSKTSLRINTIHGAKGTESKIVFIVGLFKGRGGFPHIKDDYEIIRIIKETGLDEKLAEERRCFYVALTRAKKILFLVTEKDNESVFVKELPKKFIKVIKE